MRSPIVDWHAKTFEASQEAKEVYNAVIGIVNARKRQSQELSPIIVNYGD